MRSRPCATASTAKGCSTCKDPDVTIRVFEKAFPTGKAFSIPPSSRTLQPRDVNFRTLPDASNIPEYPDIHSRTSYAARENQCRPDRHHEGPRAFPQGRKPGEGHLIAHLAGGGEDVSGEQPA